MFEKALKDLLRHPLQRAVAIGSDPFEAWIKFQDRYAEARERRNPIYRYEADIAWEKKLHELLGVPFPCPARSAFAALWRTVIGELEAKGIKAGPMGFGSWNDGDAGLARAIWCLALHTRPRKIVETGVGHGVTSRFILEALERNGQGHLWSIDVPPMAPALRQQVGLAVGDRYADRWSYVRGSSRRRLAALLAKLDQIDLFIHDSLHSERNVRFELDRAWVALRPGGAIIVDDIDANWGFHSFTRSVAVNHPSMICEAEPLRPDPRRFNNKGLFGIIVKELAA